MTDRNREGESASHVRWKWNETIGPLKDRPGRPGTWGYQNTDGIGLIEYLDVRPTVSPVCKYQLTDYSGVQTSLSSHSSPSGTDFT